MCPVTKLVRRRKAKNRQTPRSVLFTLEGKELQVANLENTIEILGTQQIYQQLTQAVILGDCEKLVLSTEFKSSVLLSPQSWRDHREHVLSTAPALPRSMSNIFIPGHSVVHSLLLRASERSVCLTASLRMALQFFYPV